MARRDFGLKKVGKYWHADFWVESEHLHRSTKATDYETAKKIAEQWRNETLCRAKGLPFDSDILVKDLWGEWLTWAKVNHSASHCDRVTADWTHHILPYVGERKAKSIRDKDAEWLRTKFLSEPSTRNAHYGKATGQARTQEGANKIMRHLRLVYRWAVKPAQMLAVVPFTVRVVDPEERVKTFLRIEQVEPFLAAVDTGTSLHLKVAVRMMLMLGLRGKEALEADWSWFSADLSEVIPLGKTGNAPPLPVTEALRVWLRKLDPKPAGLLIPAEDGKPHRKRYTHKAVERGADAIGLTGRLSPHRMRGSTATILVRAGAEAHVVQQALRHDLLETSQNYVRLDTADLAIAYERAFNAPEKPSQHSHKFSGKRVVSMLLRRLK